MRNSAEAHIQDAELQKIQRMEEELEKRKAEYRKTHGRPDDPPQTPLKGLTLSFGSAKHSKKK
jgi:hypothetical protein